MKHWLWRAVDANGDTLDLLVQARRNTKAAKRFLAKLIAQFGQPGVVITDKLAAAPNRLRAERQMLIIGPKKVLTIE